MHLCLRQRGLIPWTSTVPGIFTRDAGREQVVGFVLPFNDIFPLMQGEDMQNATELSQWWVQEYVQKSGSAP